MDTNDRREIQGMQGSGEVRMKLEASSLKPF
jgi:hypothetical protein